MAPNVPATTDEAATAANVVQDFRIAFADNVDAKRVRPAFAGLAKLRRTLRASRVPDIAFEQ